MLLLHHKVVNLGNCMKYIDLILVELALYYDGSTQLSVTYSHPVRL